MLTNEEIEQTRQREVNSKYGNGDIAKLINHIEELTKSLCEHDWHYLWDIGFKCIKCLKTKTKK